MADARETDPKMPLLFVGHGSPMNAIEDNPCANAWERVGKRVLAHGRPSAILAVSAHWFTEGLFVSDAAANRHIDDMYGFPEELYRVEYAPAGAPELARHVLELLNASPEVLRDGPARADGVSWGIDHGVWSVLCRMFPAADIPVVMMSVDGRRAPEQLFAAGRALAPLRREGVLILGSGNVVHNLRRCDFKMGDSAYPEAKAFDRSVADAALAGDFPRAADYRLHGDWRLACGPADHFDPLPVVLGAADPSEPVEVWNQAYQAGALSMTSFTFGEL